MLATAIPASWLVLIPFSMATGIWWAQTLYGIVVTFMEGIFALGEVEILAMRLTADLSLSVQA